jgi:hypothetical protein
VADCVRRLSITALLATYKPGDPLQIVLAIVVTIISMQVYDFYLPYVEDTDDSLARLANIVTVFTFFAALLIKTKLLPSSTVVGLGLIGMACSLLGASIIVVGFQGYFRMLELTLDRSDQLKENAETTSIIAKTFSPLVTVIETLRTSRLSTRLFGTGVSTQTTGPRTGPRTGRATSEDDGSPADLTQGTPRWVCSRETLICKHEQLLTCA